MDVYDIIDSYYKENGPLRTILLTHSRQVADKALALAAQHPTLPIDRRFVLTAALLHDIGIIRCDAPMICCFGAEPYLRHGICGAQMLLHDGWEKHFPLSLLQRWARVCERHTGTGFTREEIIARRLPLPARDYLPVSIEERLICYADKFFSKTQLVGAAATDTTGEKTIEQVLRGMRKYSYDSYQRFLRLHETFQ